MKAKNLSAGDECSLELKDSILAKANALCGENDAELVYLVLVGSTLYGTRVAGKSDADARGLFLPSVKSLVLEEAPQSLRFSSKGNEGCQNTAEDVDLDLWSLQYWLLKLLPAGDAGALDLLFSPSHEACVLYRRPMLDAVFTAPLRLIDTERGKGYVEYSLGQAKKYGIKGSHLGVLQAVARFLDEQSPSPEERLSSYIQRLVEVCGEERFCAVREVKGRRMLYLCGKLHEETVRVEEFVQRIKVDAGRFGERVKEAERNQGLDLKALSHALRSLMQMEELLTTGKIRFPLREREKLIDVKEGKIDRESVESRILKYLDAVNALRETAPFHGTPDKNFARLCLLSCYGLNPKISSPSDNSPAFP